MIIKNDKMIDTLPEDRNIIFLQDRPHNLKLFCVLNPGGVPYMVLVGFNGKYFYSTKSAPFEWARDLMIPAEEDVKRFKGNLPYSTERKAASNWHEMLIGSLDGGLISEEAILSEFIDITSEYLASFINHYDKIITDNRIGLTQEETWIEAVVQFLHICQMLDGEDYDYVRPENLAEIYNKGESEIRSEFFRQKAIDAYQDGDKEGYIYWSKQFNEIRKNYRKNMQEEK